MSPLVHICFALIASILYKQVIVLIIYEDKHFLHYTVFGV